jgi:glutathione S-transferase
VAPSLQNPDRKKRKRVARDRDLCDMKIKITESVEYPRVAGGEPVPVKTYTVERVKREVLHRPTPGGGYIVEKLNREELIAEHQLLTLLSGAQPGYHQQQLEDGVNGLSMAADNTPGDGDDALSTRDSTSGMAHLLAELDSYGVPGFLGEIHRHSLEHSDAIKKSSVERDRLKRSKELKKQQVCSGHPICILRPPIRLSLWFSCLPLADAILLLAALQRTTSSNAPRRHTPIGSHVMISSRPRELAGTGGR